MMKLIKRVKLLRQRQRSRKRLLLLTSVQLDDIALTQKQAEKEARQPFWV